MSLHQFSHWLSGHSGPYHFAIVLGALVALIFLCDRIKWLRG